MECSICQRELSGDFCSSCGQRYVAGRLGLAGLVTAFLSGWLSLERGFAATLWLLIKRPRSVIGNYWEGFRAYYSSPGIFLFYAIFIMGLHWNLVDHHLLGLTVNTDGLDEGFRHLFSPQFFVILLVVPVFAFTALLVHYKERHTPAEHFIAAMYLFGVWAIVFTVLSDLVLWWFDYSTQFSSFTVLMLIGSAMTYRQSEGLWAIIKSFVLQLITMILLLIALFGTLYLINPAAVQIE